MAPITWDELAERAWQLEESTDFAEALALITPYKSLFPSQSLYYQSQLRCAAHVGVESALHVMKSALADGYWFDENNLQREPALAPFLSLPAFAELLSLSSERRRQAQAGAARMLLTIQPSVAQPPYPALLALHGAGESMSNGVSHWQPLVQQGWLVALAQSSQVGNVDGYIWEDQVQARNEILAHATAISAGYSIDTEQFVIAGFSMGGGLAIQLATSQELSVRGFFAVAPYLSDIDLLIEQVKAKSLHFLRGYIVVGDEDYACFAIAQQLAEQLPIYGVECEVEVHPQVGHWFPPNFAQSLERGLAFIMKQQVSGG